MTKKVADFHRLHRLFLTSCSTNYEMKETDLFQPSMLYDYSDFAQVGRVDLQSKKFKKKI